MWSTLLALKFYKQIICDGTYSKTFFKNNPRIYVASHLISLHGIFFTSSLYRFVYRKMATFEKRFYAIEKTIPSCFVSVGGGQLIDPIYVASPFSSEGWLKIYLKIKDYHMFIVDIA